MIGSLIGASWQRQCHQSHLGWRAGFHPRPVPTAPDCPLPCAQLTVLEARMLINSATVQQGIVNVTRSLCDYLAPYEALCR